jgi:uncharacterized protein with PIN domain
LKFLLEADLDKLAKWMRFLGQDVLVLKEAINKRSIVEHIDRIFITTSRKWEKHLRDWRVNYLILPRDDWKVQLCLILKHFQIKPKLLLNRCPHCNAELELISKEDVKSAIPPMVYQFGYHFTRCAECKSIFWKGTHLPKMKRTLKSVLKRC